MELVIAFVGLAIGTLYGIFGVGSAFATPALALIGIPGMSAVVGPLPALLPGSAAGAWSYHRAGRVDRQLALRVILGALPAAIIGAFASQWVGGPLLIILSALVAITVGTRIIMSSRAGRHRESSPADRATNADRRGNATLVTLAAVGVGFASGLLANGGGFLLVPLFLLVLGLEMDEAAGTSMTIATVLTVPIIATHVLVGEFNWTVAIPFALGLIPGAILGGRLAMRLPTDRLQTAFGMMMVVLAGYLVLKIATG